MIADFAGYSKYLEDITKCYPDSGELAEMTKLYNRLIEIWHNSDPDDLLPLFSYGRLEKGLCLLDETMIEYIEFSNSGVTSEKVFTLMKEQGLKGTEALADLSLQESIEVIKEGLSRENRYSNVLMKWILKPSFMTSLKRINIDPLLYRTRESAKCPVCNAPPGMAIIDKADNTEQRFLSCCFCGYRWAFDPAGCPNCGNAKPERLSLFVGNAGCEQGTRAASCDECKTYLKTVFIKCREDKRGFHDLDMDIEDVASIPLDIIASQHSYTAVCQSQRSARDSDR